MSAGPKNSEKPLNQISNPRTFRWLSELHTLQKALTNAGGKWSTFVIWIKNNFTLGSADYQRQYKPSLYG